MGEAKRRRAFQERALANDFERRHPRHPGGTRRGGQFRASMVARALMAAPVLAELELAERSEKAVKAFEMGHLVYEGLTHTPGVHELRVRPSDLPWEQRLSDQIGTRHQGMVPTDVITGQTRAERAADKRRYGHNLGERVKVSRGPGTIVRLSNNENGSRVASIQFDDGVRVDYLIGPAHNPGQWRMDPKTGWAVKLIGGLDRTIQRLEGY